ncbi:DUF3892 domain-containing protein [uncultured Algoriphagus sp.]|uniref:DUF3892 domain-containing protein n=1 Tax=uncultured Algoriphagus sp. TaxID=417365 RepID=UPI0030EF4888|tara:strand:- start:11724 stop:12077 length:354 start_codon:yes stop_codon:yes gene_type:complete
MEKISLPPIALEAKPKPLSYNPQTCEFAYYDRVANGEQKIYPSDKWDKDSRIRLAIKRYESSEENMMVSTLNGETYSKEKIVQEIENGTPVGQSFVSLDLNYLEYYLSTFPENAFLK